MQVSCRTVLHRAPGGVGAVGFVSPASFNRGLWARLLRVLGS